MQVILLEKVANLGNLGDVVRVRDGFARNYLIPQKIARRATESALQEFEARRAELEKAQVEKLAAAEAVAAKLGDYTLTLTEKAGVDGRLFGSVGNIDIAAGLVKAGFDTIVKTQVRLPEGALKAVGEYPVSIVLHPDVAVEINVVIQGEMA
ncbi:50S ribosomal protein L9 [Achromobacter sp. F4_2707]|uniref:50S ribosomal protein L9 n=1 Tax=Achromobacter sp. F4_2707 TaxID=3114286 RepID=UPI0039C69155